MGGQTTVEVTRAESINGNENNGPLEFVRPVGEPRCVSCRVLGCPRTKVCSAADGKEDEGREGGQYLPGGMGPLSSKLANMFFKPRWRGNYAGPFPTKKYLK
jgi:hypothetical protein